MKKKVLALLILSSSAFAASDLVKEFTARRKIVQSRQKVQIYRFLRTMQKTELDLVELELLNDMGKFAARFKNYDVCFGDTETASLECYNAIGVRTFFEAGDSD